MKKACLATALACCVLCGLFWVQGAAETAPSKGLSRYQDSFDRFQDDLWEQIGFIPNQDKRESNFKLADVRIEKGRLRIETATGSFSLGGLGSKYTIRGDFDVQIDCAVEFKGDLRDMEQLAMFHVVDSTKELRDREMEAVMIAVLKPVRGDARLFTACLEKGDFKPGSGKNMDGFQGSLRIIREGDRVTTLFKKEREPDWQKLHTFQRPPNDAVVGFKIQNFGRGRSSIGASAPFAAFFDNFRINAAQEIIESDI